MLRGCRTEQCILAQWSKLHMSRPTRNTCQTYPSERDLVRLSPPAAGLDVHSACELGTLSQQTKGGEQSGLVDGGTRQSKKR